MMYKEEGEVNGWSASGADASRSEEVRCPPQRDDVSLAVFCFFLGKGCAESPAGVLQSSGFSMIRPKAMPSRCARGHILDLRSGP